MNPQAWLARLRRPAADALALHAEDRVWSYGELLAQVDALAAILRAQGVRVLATLLDNGPEWIVADLAALQTGVPHVPLPLFFSPTQIAHALDAAGVDAVLAAPGALGGDASLTWRALSLWRRPARAVALPPGTARITFTSGTTGAPKGVCLDAAAMLAVSASVAHATADLAIGRHLCALPLAVLLENVAGFYATLGQGASCAVPPLAAVGLSGSSSFSPQRLHQAVLRHRPHSLILLPQMLRAWTEWLAATGSHPPAELSLVAVGGAAVGARLLGAARAAGIPGYEGYGLSEGASVQTLNLPGADRPGSAGRPLPHARLRVAAGGEVEIAGGLFLGYLGDPAPVPEWWPTGDLGELDADGFLHLRGRKKNVLITGYGRNVSPEWVETELRAEPALAQAVVYGEARPWLAAVIWPRAADLPDPAIDAAVLAANARLPDYARVRRWVRAAAPFDAASGMATANGRPRRAAIAERHREVLAGCFPV